MNESKLRLPCFHCRANNLAVLGETDEYGRIRAWCTECGRELQYITIQSILNWELLSGGKKMPLIVKEPEGGSGDFEPREPVPAGVHAAICYSVYDLGTHSSEYAGQVRERREVLIMWELPDVRIDIDGKDLPKALSKRFTLSLHEKAALRHMLQGWRNKQFTPQELAGFDLEKLLGVPCQLQVIHKQGTKNPERTFANVGAVLPAMKGYNKKAENPLRFFAFDDPQNENIPEGTPDWVSDIIMDSKEWDEVPAELQEPASDDDGEEPAPF